MRMIDNDITSVQIIKQLCNIVSERRIKRCQKLYKKQVKLLSKHLQGDPRLYEQKKVLHER